MTKLDLNLWLQPDDVKDVVVVEFLDEGEFKDIALPNNETKRVFEVGIKLPSGEKRLWTMNETSQRAVAQKFGVDTVNWIGKAVELFKTQQNVHGQMKWVVYAKIPS